LFYSTSSKIRNKKILKRDIKYRFLIVDVLNFLNEASDCNFWRWMDLVVETIVVVSRIFGVAHSVLKMTLISSSATSDSGEGLTYIVLSNLFQSPICCPSSCRYSTYFLGHKFLTGHVGLTSLLNFINSFLIFMSLHLFVVIPGFLFTPAASIEWHAYNVF